MLQVTSFALFSAAVFNPAASGAVAFLPTAESLVAAFSATCVPTLLAATLLLETGCGTRSDVGGCGRSTGARCRG
jgi:hypothetical protein